MNGSATLRELRWSLADASDLKLGRVVEMVDALVDRGAADNLLAPFRSRLALLRPVRPLRFSRLLFLPLDPIVVGSPVWRAGQGQIPRSAISPLAAAVRTALGGAAQIDSLIAGCMASDQATVALAGGLLWSKAGVVVAQMDTLPGWVEATGLAEQAWPEIRASIAGVLLVADRICGVDAPAFASQHAVTLLLNDVQQRAPLAMDAVISVLLAIDTDTKIILAAASRHSGRSEMLSNAAVSRALDALPQRIGGRIGNACLEDAVSEANRLGAFLKAVDGPGRSQQVRSALAKVAIEVSQRFKRGIADELAPATSCGSLLADAELLAAEGIARSLHKLELAGRSVGGETQLDVILDDAWTLLISTAQGQTVSLDQVRIAEILFGSDRAANLLPL